MHKRNKVIVLFILAIIVIALMFQYKEKKQTIQQQYSIIKTEKKDAIETPQSSKKTDDKLDHQDTANEEAKPPPLLFSENEIINAHLIDSRYYHCQMLLGDDHYGKGKMIDSALRAKTEKQKVHIQKYYDDCVILNKQNPELLLNQSKTYNQYKKDLIPNTFIEKVLTRKINLAEEDSKELYHQFFQELRKLPKEIYANVDLFYLFSEFMVKHSWKDALRLLKIHDLQQAIYALDTALIYYICKKSELCDNDHFTHYFYCSFNENHCDLESYEEYFALTLTPGQYADMLLLLPYIESFLGPIDSNSNQN